VWGQSSVRNGHRSMLPAVGCGGLVAFIALFALTPAQAQDAADAPPRRLRSIDAPSRTQPLAPPDLSPAEGAGDIPSAIPSGDVSAMPPDEDDDPLEPRPRGGERPVLKDGDLNDPDMPVPRDGVIATREPEAPQDGTDPTTVDSRPREEAQLFENPNVVDDPFLYQIEDTDPVANRRAQRLFRFEPYDPVGIKMGSFIFFPELELSGDATSNLFYSPKAHADVAFDVRPSARFVSNWTTHAFEFSARGFATFYNEYSTENDKAYTLEARGRIDISKRTNLQIVASHDVGQESRSLTNARDVGTRPDITTDRLAAALNHRFNRLTLQLRGSVADYVYGPATTDGVTFSNAALNYTAYEQAVRATWSFKPALSAFSEVVTNQRNYSQLDPAGLDRSSTGERYRAGLGFGTTGEVLRGELSAGYGVQHPVNANLPDAQGVIFDANATWRATPLTSFLLTARSDFIESQILGVSFVHSQQAGLEARQSFQRNLIGTAGISYTNNDYIGSSITEQDVRETVGLEYYLNRETMLFTRYTHVDFSSGFAGSSYTSDAIRIGMRLRE